MTEQLSLFAEINKAVDRGNKLITAAQGLEAFAITVEEDNKCYRLTYKSRVICEGLPDEATAARLALQIGATMKNLAQGLKSEAEYHVKRLTDRIITGETTDGTEIADAAGDETLS